MMIAVDALQVLYEQKCRAVRTSILVMDANVEACGFLEATNGMVLTSARAMELARTKSEADAEKKRAREVSDHLRSVKATRRDSDRRIQNENMCTSLWAARSSMAGLPEAAFFALVRPMAQRREIVLLGTSPRRQAQSSAFDSPNI